MGATALADAGFFVALLDRNDRYHAWAKGQAADHPPPWGTCEPVVSETFYLLGSNGLASMTTLLRRNAVQISFRLSGDLDRVLELMSKYADLPMSLADACLVRMTEIVSSAVVLTTDRDFHVYRRFGRQTVPCVLPWD